MYPEYLRRGYSGVKSEMDIQKKQYFPEIKPTAKGILLASSRLQQFYEPVFEEENPEAASLRSDIRDIIFDNPRILVNVLKGARGTVLQYANISYGGYLPWEIGREHSAYLNYLERKTLAEMPADVSPKSSCAESVVIRAKQRHFQCFDALREE